MTSPDPCDAIGIPLCPACLTMLVDEGDDPDGADARWVCPACGLVSLADL